VYEQLERQKKRGVLVYSSPGMGKSSTIAHFSSESLKEDPGTVVVVWPTSKIDADDVTDFLAASTKFSKRATKMILILEDIGGSEHENRGPRGVDSGILNLLDGVSVAFKLPTFIVATTNHPENLLSSLADRPGRFDLMIELKAPAYQERIKLLEFIAKRNLSDEEKEVFKSKDCDSLSIAHLDEIVVRSLLHGKTLKQTLREVLDHKKNVADAFEKAKKLGGIGFSTLSKEDDY
jgi:ATP-dependent 26S proteasome regulatory subunit